MRYKLLLLAWALAVGALGQTPQASPFPGSIGATGPAGAAAVGNVYPCVSASGSATTYTCTTGSSVTLAGGMLFLWTPDETCSGSPTLNIDGNGAVSLASGASAFNLNLCSLDAPHVGVAQILLYYYAFSQTLQAVNFPLGVGVSSCFISGGVPAMSDGTGDTACSNATSGAYGLRMSGLEGWSLDAKPAISGACSTTIGAGASNLAGFFTTTTTGTCAFTLTWGNSVTYATGAVCTFNDITHPASLSVAQILQTGYSTTTATGSGPTTSGDTVYYQCLGF
jgi:hypothetical protein